MSTEEQRAAIRARVAKHYAQNKERILGKQRKARLCRQEYAPVYGAYQTYELADPREEGRPRMIGYCRSSVCPVWVPFWAVMHHSGAPWAVWLRELAEAGLEPFDRVEWAVGRFRPLKLAFVRDAVALRLHRVPAAKIVTSLVACVTSDGRVEKYTSILAAAKATQQDRRIIRRCAEQCAADRGGRVWFYD